MRNTKSTRFQDHLKKVGRSEFVARSWYCICPKLIPGTWYPRTWYVRNGADGYCRYWPLEYYEYGSTDRQFIVPSTSSTEPRVGKYPQLVSNTEKPLVQAVSAANNDGDYSQYIYSSSTANPLKAQ